MTHVKSCACRFSHEDDEIGLAEYLCPNHQEEFILQLYNSQQSLNKLMPTIHEMNDIHIESILDDDEKNNKIQCETCEEYYNQSETEFIYSNFLKRYVCPSCKKSFDDGMDTEIARAE